MRMVLWLKEGDSQGQVVSQVTGTGTLCMSLVLFKVYQLHSDFLEIFKVYGIAHSPNLIFFINM